MFRTLANASLRRSLHTSSRAASSSTRPARLRAVLGASAVATSYFVWSAWYRERIALDSSSSPPKRASSIPKASTPSEDAPITVTPTEPSILEDAPVPSEAPAGEPKAAPEEGEAGESSGGGGGAFNPETGEINWDCPCLGGMAHGPCGMQFREAFSCFVFSEAEPKGIDCVEKFKAMQECFREHPDVYGDDIMNDDDDEDFTPDASPVPDDAAPPPEQQPAAVHEQSDIPVPSTEKKDKPRKAAAPVSH